MVSTPTIYYISPSNPKRPVAHKKLRSSAYEREVTTDDKIKAAIGSTVGTLIPLLLMMRKQGLKNPLKLKYGLSDLVVMAASSIAGGVAVGMIGEDKPTRKNKFKEGVFQFLNASVPTWLVGGALKLAEVNPKMNNIPTKIATVALSLIVGLFGTATVSNLIVDPLDKEPDRKLTLKDTLANIDDAIGALVLAKIPLIDKLHLESLLPAIFGYCGYRAGKSN